MNANKQRNRELIASQAGEWVAAHKGGTLSAAERRAFHEWLTASPVHIEEYLGVALIARHLPLAADDPDVPLESILERLRKETDNVTPMKVDMSWSEVAVRARPQPFKLLAAAAAVAVTSLGLFWWNGSPVTSPQYATHHGELRSLRLSDGSSLQLNTDTSVTVRYSRSERRIELQRGEALFEVAHQPNPFRVVAGSASILALGTRFSVYREAGSTQVTVLRGRVAVSSLVTRSGSVTVEAGRQVRVMEGQPPDNVTPADVERATAWLHRQIVFERQPLAVVATEFNRYTALPIEIETPELRTLPVTGIFSVDDTETFLDFLRTFQGVTIQTGPTRVRVFHASVPTSVKPETKPN
jgi:transmembrane sensor